MDFKTLAWAWAAVGMAAATWGAAPELRPGTCTYLVGAPAGAVAATSEERGADSAVGTPCLLGLSLGSGLDGPNSTQLHAEAPVLVADVGCTAWSSVWHEFHVDAPEGAMMAGSVAMIGHVNGSLSREISRPLLERTSVDVRLSEVDPAAGPHRSRAEANVLFWQGVTRERQLDHPFAVSLAGVFQGGRTYRVELRISIEYSENDPSIDFGPPGSGRGVRYDSIEVCLADSNAGVDPGLALMDLEEKLYRKECLPTVWMPAAQGGRLEQARGLLEDLIARAEATGDPGANVRVAGMRLAAADEAIAEGSFQRACRNLGDGVRALTTP